MGEDSFGAVDAQSWHAHFTDYIPERIECALVRVLDGESNFYAVWNGNTCKGR